MYCKYILQKKFQIVHNPVISKSYPRMIRRPFYEMKRMIRRPTTHHWTTTHILPI